MSDRLDSAAKGLASSMPRRQLLKKMAAGVTALIGLATVSDKTKAHEFRPPVNYTLPINQTIPINQGPPKFGWNEWKPPQRPGGPPPEEFKFPEKPKSPQVNFTLPPVNYVPPPSVNFTLPENPGLPQWPGQHKDPPVVNQPYPIPS